MRHKHGVCKRQRLLGSVAGGLKKKQLVDSGSAALPPLWGQQSEKTPMLHKLKTKTLKEGGRRLKI